MASGAGEPPPPPSGEKADPEMELRPRPSSSTATTSTKAAGKRRVNSERLPEVRVKKPRLLAKTHTTPIAGFLQPAYHPFTKAEVPRVRERFARHFSTTALNPFNTWHVMQDLVKMAIAYKRVGDPMSYWITNIQSELMQREWTGTGVIPVGKCYNEVVIEHACAQSLNVLAELIGDSPEASRNPVVDRVELLVYNKGRAINRAAVKGSKTRLARWNQQHGVSTQEEDEREEAEHRIKGAQTALTTSIARKAEMDKQLHVVEHGHQVWAWVPNAERPASKDLIVYHARAKASDQIGHWRVCEAKAKAEAEVAAKRQKRVWGYVDAVTKNQTWLKNKASFAADQRDKLTTSVTALKLLPHVVKHPEAYAGDDNVLAEHRKQIAIWEELAARMICMRQDGEKRLKELSPISTEDTAYVNKVGTISTACADAIKRLEGKEEAKDDDDDEVVVCTGTQTREDKNKALLAAAVDLTSDGE